VNTPAWSNILLVQSELPRVALNIFAVGRKGWGVFELVEESDGNVKRQGSQ